MRVGRGLNRKGRTASQSYAGASEGRKGARSRDDGFLGLDEAKRRDGEDAEEDAEIKRQGLT